MITFQNVTKHYDNGSVVVDGLSLVAPGGKITVFVGPSGCGKTTSLRMINRLVEPSSGRILLNGEATEQMDIVQLAPPYWLCHSKCRFIPPQKHYRQHCHHRDSQRRRQK